MRLSTKDIDRIADALAARMGAAPSPIEPEPCAVFGCKEPGYLYVDPRGYDYGYDHYCITHGKIKSAADLAAKEAEDQDLALQDAADRAESCKRAKALAVIFTIMLALAWLAAP